MSGLYAVVSLLPSAGHNEVQHGKPFTLPRLQNNLDWDQRRGGWDDQIHVLHILNLLAHAFFKSRLPNLPSWTAR